MVIAGPGTGKTQVLAMRTANILSKTHARPSNILCLTFSTSGATAMRERLRSLIGSDAYSVTVNTVHGFCDAIIKRNATVFSDWDTGKHLSDVRKYQAMQGIIDQISDSSALINAKNPYERIPAILGRISECKREGKTLDDLERVAKDYDALMAKKSKPTTKQHVKNLLQAKKFRDFVDLFARYQEYCSKHGAYDYDDMILVVSKALREEDWLLQGYQELYQYILVDEAQDLNGAQWKVIERLTTYDASPNEPNFFLVGDDDQAIYRFQGANIEHLMQFRDRFPKAPVIVLKTSYRSTQTILDAAGRLIAHNEERLVGRIPDLHKDLVAHTKDKGSDPLLLRSPSDAAEPWLIADCIEEQLKKSIPLKEIAVLTQTNHELRPIYDVLRARGIPVILHGKADLLTHPLVMQVLLMLRCAQGSSDTLLLQAMACDTFGCAVSDLGRISQAAREQKRPIGDILLDIEASSLPFADREKLIHARDTLLDLRLKQESRTVLLTVETALRLSGISASACTIDPIDLAVIEAFFQYVKQRSLETPDFMLRQFIEELQFFRDEAFSQVRLTYQIPHLVSEGVALLTAHQSKGLEFQAVILSSFRDGHWDERRSPSGLSIPEDLLFGWETEQKRFEKHQDERRVAYVAMTRAKRELIMICPKEFSVGERIRTVAPSAFFAEAGPLPEEDRSLRDPDQSSLLLLPPKSDHDAELRAYLHERLENFALSATSLTRFLKDPQEFLRIDLLQQPEEFTESELRAFGYGSATHWALREWAYAIQKREPFTEKEFVASFASYLQEHTILTELQKRDLLSQAKGALAKYYIQRLQGTLPVLYAVERDYRGHIALKSKGGESIPLKGKIDRIDQVAESSADVIIIDYKTGAPKSMNDIRGGLEEGFVSRTMDGSIFRQMAFYALLLEEAEPLLAPQAFAVEFIGERGEDPVTRQFGVTEKEKDDLRKLIREVWGKITALDFTPIAVKPGDLEKEKKLILVV
ncbi:MAG: DNA helicase II / ATP-dependent DNA helicase PcrA [Candidatus Peregrinibacteria bacterium Greene0416_62]|nr:MAG: DNA helicase II / ATP-dependent DNA helicase PcrA [Candidatus Peregrinibacteria bacterium Greene0416_62]